MKNKQKLMKFEEKNENFAFFENVIFAIFGAAEKWKKSNHQKCKNLIKRPYFFIASCQRRALNTIFGSSEPSRKIFFSRHQDADLSKFSFFAKNKSSPRPDFYLKPMKNLRFSGSEISKNQKHWFFNGFLQKMKILTSQQLDGWKKNFPGLFRWSKRWA